MTELIYAQKTSQLEIGKIFESQDSYRTKKYYSKELVEISKDSFLIENCYYIKVSENKLERFAILHSSYKVFESAIDIKENRYLSRWNYTKMNDSLYYIHNSSEKEYAKSLIPLIKHGKFINFRDNDTVMITNYQNGIFKDYYFHETNEIVDSIHLINDVETQPSYPGGENSLLKDLLFDYSKFGITQESQIQGNIFISFVVSKTGEVKNIKILKGIDPYIDYSAIKIVSELKKFTPGINQGQTVDVNMIVCVNAS